MNCDQFHDWKFWGALSMGLLLEFWLGKTQKTRASSILEMCAFAVIASILWVISRFINKGKSNE